MAALPIRAPEQVPNRMFTPQYEGSFGRQSSFQFNIYDDATALLGQDALILDGYDLIEMFKSTDSREIIKIIGQHGVLKLGEMDVDVSLIDRGFKGRTTKTMGSSDLEVQNWESMWIEKLMQGKTLNPAFADDRTVRVEAFAVTIRNASGAGRNGLLHPILRRWQAKACPIEVWGLPAIRAVVSFKWNHWAKRYLLMEFFLYALWTIIFMVEALTYKEEDLRRNMQTLWKNGFHSRTVVVLSILSHVFMLPFTLIEISTLIKYKTKWYSVWNIIDVSTQVIQVACTVVYLTETDIKPNTFNLILAIQTILLLVKIQFFARAFVAVESSMLDMLSAVLRQLRWYLLVVVLTVYVFTVAVFVLFRLDRKPSIEDVVDYCKEECDPIQPWDKLKECKPWECNNGLCDKPETFKYCIPRPFLEFQNIFRSVLTIYGIMLGAWQMEDYLEDAPFAMYTMFLFCCFMLIMSVLLYNLLIGMMIDGHARQMEVRKLWVHVSRAEIIDELETALPKFITKRYQEPFVHALRIVPPKEASLESLWGQIGATETSIAASKEDFERELRKTEREIMEAIDGISGKIRDHLGLTEEEYVSRLYSKLGISKSKTADTLKKMRSMAGSQAPFARLKTLPVKRNQS